MTSQRWSLVSRRAIVRDEGRDIIGGDAIRAWKIETGAKYRITVEPLEGRAEAGKRIVIAKVSGTSPAAQQT